MHTSAAHWQPADASRLRGHGERGGIAWRVVRGEEGGGDGGDGGGGEGGSGSAMGGGGGGDGMAQKRRLWVVLYHRGEYLVNIV